MPIKFSKDISTRLFKYVRSVDVKFNPFDNRTRSARELLRQVQAERYGKANPKLTVRAHVTDSPEAPSVVFSFVNGTERVFDNSQQYNCDEMLSNIYFTAMQLDNEYEMQGKNIDDQS